MGSGRIKRLSIGLAVAACLAANASVARAQPAVGVLQGTNTLVSFDTGLPATLTNVQPITGLVADDKIAALDYRWQIAAGSTTQPRLFGLGVTTAGLNHDVVRLYTIDAVTGAATPLGAPIDLTNATGVYAMGIDPTADQIRVINSKGTNLRLDPNTGSLIATDTAVGGVPGIGAMDYDRVSLPPNGVPTDTTAYVINAENSQLLTLGGVNQTPSPSGGTTAAVGTLTGLTVSYIQDLNLDIAPDGTAFATVSSAPSGAPSLYTVNLTTAAPTLLGSLQAPLSAFAIVPSSTVQFADATATASEGGPAVVTVTRSGSLSSSSTVFFATADGSAGNADYTPSSGIVTFAPDETTKQITIPTTADSLDEPDESFSVTLSSPGALATLGSPTASTVTIADSFVPPDKTPPSVTLSGVPSSIARAALLKGLLVGVTSSEPAALKAKLLGTTSKVHLSAFNLSLASASLGLAAGPRTLTLKPKRALIGKPRKRVKLRLAVTATDAAGNASTTTRSITLKPSKPKTKGKRR
jgi:hypothetical protein